MKLGYSYRRKQSTRVRPYFSVPFVSSCLLCSLPSTPRREQTDEAGLFLQAETEHAEFELVSLFPSFPPVRFAHFLQLRGARPRNAARLPRAQGNRARPVRRDLAYAGARGHAPAGRAEAARRRAQRRGAQRSGAARFAARAPLGRCRAGRPRGQAHRVPRAPVDDHRCAGARRAARRHALDRARPPVAPVDGGHRASRHACHDQRTSSPRASSTSCSASTTCCSCSDCC